MRPGPAVRLYQWSERELPSSHGILLPGSGPCPGRPYGSCCIGGLAQLVEHLLCKQGVNGSSPLSSTFEVIDMLGTRTAVCRRRGMLRHPRFGLSTATKQIEK